MLFNYKVIYKFMENILLKNITELLLAELKETCFVKGYEASDEEAMGMLVSKFFEYNGDAILKASSLALENANFHKEAEVVEALIK